MLKALVGYLPSLEEEPPVFRPAGTGAQPPSLQLMPVMLPRLPGLGNWTGSSPKPIPFLSRVCSFNPEAPSTTWMLVQPLHSRADNSSYRLLSIDGTPGVFPAVSVVFTSLEGRYSSTLYK